MDKNAIAASSILGFITDNGLTPEQYNNLATFFYVGVLVSQIPHAFAFQYLPVAKYLSAMIFLWALFVSMHCVANSYAPLGEYPQKLSPYSILSIGIPPAFISSEFTLGHFLVHRYTGNLSD